MDENIENGFYVAQDECLTCGMCENIAPELFSSGKISYVKKQPRTVPELRKMFRASRTCMVDCIYYNGNDELLKTYFAKIYDCYEARGNVCSDDNCPCFDAYLEAKSK